MHRLYENNDIVIFWNSDKCFHAKECVTGSPKVFDRSKRPWIRPENEESFGIWKTVEKCPSGALSILYRHEIDVVMEQERCRSAAYKDETLIGECEYRESEGAWCIYHTGVDPDYGGKGIARRLVYKVLEAAEKSGMMVTATCSYAVKVLEE